MARVRKKKDEDLTHLFVMREATRLKCLANPSQSPLGKGRRRNIPPFQGGIEGDFKFSLTFFPLARQEESNFARGQFSDFSLFQIPEYEIADADSFQ
jgi:hypothetical protein